MNLESSFSHSASGLIDSLDRVSVYRTIAIIGALGLIFAGCVIVLKPFLPALMLATIFYLSANPAFHWLSAKLGGRVTLAALLMTFFLAICFLVPLIFIGSSLADNFRTLFTMIIDTIRDGPQDPPRWVRDIPWIGPDIHKFMRSYPEGQQGPMFIPFTEKIIAIGTAIGRGIIDLSIGVIITFFFFRHGHVVSRHVRVLIDRFAGPRGQHLLNVSKNTMIGVVYGILGTALAQGGLATIGFWIADVPGAPFLGLLTFMLSFLPVGPPLVWIPAAAWLFSEGNMAMGVFMVVWGLCAISAIDNVIRPYFISRGSNQPLLLVLLGVFGGIIAFGFIGLFIGPTLLAVANTIIMQWSSGRPQVITESSLEQAAPAP